MSHKPIDIVAGKQVCALGCCLLWGRLGLSQAEATVYCSQVENAMLTRIGLRLTGSTSKDLGRLNTVRHNYKVTNFIVTELTEVTEKLMT